MSIGGSAFWGGDRAPLGAGVVVCDPRFQVEITFSRSHDLKTQIILTREAVRSVQCAVTDGNRAAMIPSLRLPEGFGTVPIESGLQFQALNGEVLVTNFTAGRMQVESEYYDPAIHAILSAMDAKTLRSSLVDVAPTRNRRNASEKITKAFLPSEKLTAYVGSLYCKQVGATLMIIWLPPRPADELSWERFAQVDCPTGKPISLPPYASLLESACTRGDTAACDIRKTL